MEDICNFIPPKPEAAAIEYFHFVYETCIRKLRQPFSHANFYAHLVFKGTAVLKTEGHMHTLAPGTLFFTFPFQAFEMDADPDFTYFYISFNGTGAHTLLNGLNISEQNAVFSGFEHLLDFWMTSARRITHANANILTESVLLYTLSYIDSNGEQAETDNNRFEDIIEYINHHFADPNLSVSKIADVFFYRKKYLSSLFIKKTNIKFTNYLNKLRVQHATRLLSDNTRTVSEIAQACGFTDPFYFSKVFKKHTGKTPTEFKKYLCTVSPAESDRPRA